MFSKIFVKAMVRKKKIIEQKDWSILVCLLFFCLVTSPFVSVVNLSFFILAIPLTNSVRLITTGCEIIMKSCYFLVIFMQQANHQQAIFGHGRQNRGVGGGGGTGGGIPRRFPEGDWGDAF